MKKRILFFMLFSLMVIVWSISNAQAQNDVCYSCSSGDHYCGTDDPLVKSESVVEWFCNFCRCFNNTWWSATNCTGQQMYSGQAGPFCSGGSPGNGSGITIKGDYAIVGTDTCVSHQVSHHRDPDTANWTKTNNFQGTITFNDNGTGVAKLTLVSLMYPKGETTTIDVVAPVIYSIDPASRLMTVTFILTGHVTSGDFINKWLKTSSFTLTGIVPDDFKTILLSSAVDRTPTQADYTTLVEFYNDKNFKHLYHSYQDVCGRMGTLSLMPALQNQQ